MKRTKYEPAGGVVPLLWVRGPASPDTLRANPSRVLVEVWTGELSESWSGNPPTAYVTHLAVIRVASLDAEGTLLLDGKPWNHNGVLRRHAVLERVVRHTNLTLESWK